MNNRIGHYKKLWKALPFNEPAYKKAITLLKEHASTDHSAEDRDALHTVIAQQLLIASAGSFGEEINSLISGTIDKLIDPSLELTSEIIFGNVSETLNKIIFNLTYYFCMLESNPTHANDIQLLSPILEKIFALIKTSEMYFVPKQALFKMYSIMANPNEDELQNKSFFKKTFAFLTKSYQVYYHRLIKWSMQYFQQKSSDEQLKHINCIQKILNDHQNIDINYYDTPNQNTVLHDLICQFNSSRRFPDHEQYADNYLALITLLIKYNPDCLLVRNQEQKTPLDLCEDNEFKKMIKDIGTTVKNWQKFSLFYAAHSKPENATSPLHVNQMNEDTFEALKATLYDLPDEIQETSAEKKLGM